MRTSGDRRDLFVAQVAELHALGGARIGDTKLREVAWADDDDLLLTVSSTSLPPLGFTGPRQEWYQLVTYDIARDKLAGVNFDVANERTFNTLWGAPAVREVDGKTMLFVPGLYVAQRRGPRCSGFRCPIVVRN